jgi:phosphoribosylformimino-5-aminoimidazole carboxamide ribotide isomerase
MQGDYARETVYGADPVEMALRWQSMGAQRLHVVDLDGARSGEPEHLEPIESICRSTGLRVEVGGGIRNEETIRQYLGAGVARVILGTAALQNWDWFDELAHTPTLANKLVLGLDARKGKLAVAGWEQQLELTALEVAQRVSDWPLAAIVFTDIATDGTLAGPNVNSTRELAEATQIPVASSGGVGTLDHLRILRELPLEGAIVGRALYEGTMTIDQALDVLERGA